MLASSDPTRITEAVALTAQVHMTSHPELYGDGNAAGRIADIVIDTFANVHNGREISIS